MGNEQMKLRQRRHSLSVVFVGNDGAIFITSLSLSFVFSWDADYIARENQIGIFDMRVFD